MPASTLGPSCTNCCSTRRSINKSHPSGQSALGCLLSQRQPLSYTPAVSHVRHTSLSELYTQTTTTHITLWQKSPKHQIDRTVHGYEGKLAGYGCTVCPTRCPDVCYGLPRICSCHVINSKRHAMQHVSDSTVQPSTGQTVNQSGMMCGDILPLV